jgi:hypothetical protein
MRVIYSAVQRFDSAYGDAWTKFIVWSGLTHLHEVISLDGILCPSVFQELAPEDWEHNVQENYKTQLFRDLDYLLDKAAGNDRVNILAVMQEPTTAQLVEFTDPRFVFRGFDLIECDGGNISALVNCGGFPKAFSSADLSDCGLLGDHATALKVQKLLSEEYPEEQHARCDVWAIWQMKMAR